MSSAPFEGADDVVLPFAVEPLDIRGRVVRLGPSIDTILARHGYPDIVSRVLGEAAALDGPPGLVPQARGTLSAPDQDGWRHRHDRGGFRRAGPS